MADQVLQLEIHLDPRGPRGYGFNLAGEKPCYFSRVQENGQAYKSGLRTGDFLSKINDQKVDEFSHYDVIKLIAKIEQNAVTERNANEQDRIGFRLTILRKSQNYGDNIGMKKIVDVGRTGDMSTSASCDSDSDNEIWREQRRKAMMKQVRTRSRSSKNIHAIKRRKSKITRPKCSLHCEPNRDKFCTLKNRVKRQQAMNRCKSAPSVRYNEYSMIANPADSESGSTVSSSTDSFSNAARTPTDSVLVYIGAVPISSTMYEKSTPRQLVRYSLQSLRAQRAKARTVLFKFASTNFSIVNSKLVVVNRFSPEKVVFAEICRENEQFFGILMTLGGSTENPGPESPGLTFVCHIFAADLELLSHSCHGKYANKFSLECCQVRKRDNAVTTQCRQFPADCKRIVKDISHVVEITKFGKEQHQNVSMTGMIDGSPLLQEASATRFRSSNRNFHQRAVETTRTIPNPAMNQSFDSDSFSTSTTTMTGSMSTWKSTTTTLSGNSSFSALVNNYNPGGRVYQHQTSENLSRRPVSLFVDPNKQRIVRFDDERSNTIDIAGNSNECLTASVRDSSIVKLSLEGETKLHVENCSLDIEKTNSNILVKEKLCPIVETAGQTLVPYYPIKDVDEGLIFDSSESIKISAPSLDRRPPLPPAGLATSTVPTTNNPAQSSLSVDPCPSVTENHKKPPFSLTAEFKRRNFAVNNNNNKDRKVAESNSNEFKSPFSYFTSSSSNENGKLNKKSLTAKSVQALNDLHSCPTANENQFSGVRSAASATNSLHRKSSIDETSDQNTNTSNNKQSSSLFKRLTRSDMRFSVKVKQGKKERLESWVHDFEVLLRDPAGLYAFSEFLSKQYCQENLNFWIACENFKLLSGDELIKENATTLYDKFFACGCPEPVNVDSVAKQNIEKSIKGANFHRFTFDIAQNQIFHLMKYDCYPRFLKSDEYNRCWTLAVEKNETLPCMKQKFLNNVNDMQLQYQKEFDAHLSKKFSGSAASLHRTIPDFEKDHLRNQLAGDEYQKKRKSLLPWKSNFIGRSNNSNNYCKDKKKSNNGVENIPPNAQLLPQKSQSQQQQHHRSTLSKFPTFEIDRKSTVNNLTVDRKQAWRSGKHASTPASGTENGHLWSQSVGSSRESWISSRSSHEDAAEACFTSVAGSSSTSSPFSSNVLLIPPPDVVPHPEPPSSSPKSGSRSSRSSLHVSNDSALEIYQPSPLRSSTPSITTFPQCTIILPFREKVLANLEPNISVKEWLYKHAPIWNLNPDATDILDFTTNESVDLSQLAERVLANKVIRLEGGVLFKLEIPLVKDQRVDSSSKKKLIGVKAAADSTAAQALRPILSKYGLNLDEMIVTITGSNEILPNHAPISQANNKKLTILTQEEFQEWVHRDSREIRQHTSCADSVSQRSIEDGHWTSAGETWQVEYV